MKFSDTVFILFWLVFQLNKAKTSETEDAFLGLHLSISKDNVSIKFTINMTILIVKLSISHF